MTNLANPGAFFAALKASRILGSTLEQSEVDGLNVLTTASGDAGWGPKFTAYALATAYHETAGTMQPIRERGGPQYLTNAYDVRGDNPARAKRFGNTTPGDGVRYCGRGYVQLTWRLNYDKLGNLLGYPLAGNPDLAMRPDIAAQILVRGMADGLFTGKKLADYITNAKCDFIGARRIINGTDKAAKIAGHAETFLAALRAGEWA
jgi:putative chitinase